MWGIQQESFELLELNTGQIDPRLMRANGGRELEKRLRVSIGLPERPTFLRGRGSEE